MKNIIVATFVIIGLSSTIKVEAKAFHFLPLRFDYNRDKTNDHQVVKLVYSSPLTGRTYNVDYLSKWTPHNDASTTAAPPLPPHPFGHIFNWDVQWNFNHGAKAENSAAVSKPPVTLEAPEISESSIAASTASQGHSGGHNGQHGGHKFDLKWSYDYNHGGSASNSPTQTSSANETIKHDDETQVKSDKNGTSLDHEDGEVDEEEEENGIDPTSNGQ